jgi:iron(III) transport system ATP-binding protein
VTAIRLENIAKRFGDTTALNDINLDIAAGELFFLLGPSGCGKSTLLRLLAGLLQPDSGRILFNERDVTHLSTEHRNAVMCFQSYALWPHMTVSENVRFGPAVRGESRAAQHQRIDEVLKLVQMETYGRRKPNQLSGGQQQRVALARALAVKPACLLLDEPLSNLDAKLRLEMRSEIRRICKKTGFTTIYVTHDQKEALSVADRIGVMRDGKLIQVGLPAELYMRPRSSFVAEFIGATNLLPGTVIQRRAREFEVETAAGVIVAAAVDSITSSRVVLSIRPERIRFVHSPDTGSAIGKNRMAGKIIEQTFLGESSEHLVQVYGSWLRVASSPPAWEMKGDVTLEFSPQDVVVLPE